MSLPIAILAGGLATRLRPMTEPIPKSLVDVAGQPFAVHQIELLRRHGLTNIVFLVAHLGEMICDALGDGTRWGVHLRHVFDGPRALGTGGALQKFPHSYQGPQGVKGNGHILGTEFPLVDLFS